MAKSVDSKQRWVAGISDFIKEGTQDSYYFGRSINHRSDPRSITLNPRTIKESGSIIEDLPKWSEITPCGEMIFYGNAGKIYKRSSAGVYTKLREVANSHGNGMSYFGEDNFIYYTGDKTIGRYGPVCSTNPQFVDDFFGSQGGTPLNTYSLWLQSASSQYASRADTASLSVMGDLSLEAYIYPKSLPASSSSMTLIGKWNEASNKRSYKLDIVATNGYFGDGSDGALTISTDTTDAPIDSACSGTTGTTTLSATNASFAAGQVILIHQTRGTGAGTWQRNKIVSYTAGTITLESALNATYTSSGNSCAQVIVMKQYTDVTVNSGKTWTAKAWDGTVGGILTFLSNGTTTITGSINANGKGYRGGYRAATVSNAGYAGEGTAGPMVQPQNSPNGSGGSGGNNGTLNTGGAGGGNATVGESGGNGSAGYYGATIAGGLTSGSADLTTMTFGGGGGGQGAGGYGGTTYRGGNGGGIVFIAASTFTATGSIVANGEQGNLDPYDNVYGGSGAGGSVLLKSQVATLGTAIITALGGAGQGSYSQTPGQIIVPHGGAGGDGRIHLDYYTSYTGTTNPTLNVTQDSSLYTNTGWSLRLQVSNNGTTVGTYTKPITPVIDTWQHVASSWNASTSTAELFYNGVSLGTQTGTVTSIDDNNSELFIGANKNSSGTATNFYNGYIDEVRIWSTTKTAEDFQQNLSQQALTTLPYMQAYYKFNNDYADASGNSNTLTGTNTPTFVTNVPFPSPTTRLDIDQSATTTGSTYTLPTAINENGTSRKTFVPNKDPQKSISVLVAAKGTGNWKLTVHDAYNNEITSKTVTNANMATGYYEFVFSEPWRPLLNANYHFHLTSTVADGTVTTTNVDDLETVSYRTYYQFLVTDTEFHPVAKMLQFLVFGNERYVGTYEATLYDPNTITLPAGYKVRCFGYYKEYLAIGTTKGTSITSQDSGRIYFWDGIATTYNFYIDVPEGGINALLGSKGKLFVWAGYQGDILVYQGGDSAEQIKRIPLIEPDKYVEVYPGAVSMWKMLIRFGICGGSDSSDIQRGVYTWGSQNVRYPESLSFDYPISTGNYSTTVTIGLVTVYNQRLLIGWGDNVSYGIDYVDAANNPYPSGTIEQIIDDDQAVWKEKEIMQVVANFKPLVSGESVDVKYKLDRASAWTSLGAVTTVGETVARFVVATNGARYHEIQYAADLATTTTTSPTLLGLTIEKELLQGEERVG